MPRLRTILRRTGLVLASSALTLLAAELVVRATTDPVPAHPGRPEDMVRVPASSRPSAPQELLYLPKAGGRKVVIQTGSGDVPDREVRYLVNHDGYRGEPVPRERTPGVPRIIALGDSFTFGTGVLNEETWPFQLERALEARDDLDDVEILNWGVEVYNAHQFDLYYRWRSEGWNPDIVIACLYINDASGEGRGDAQHVKPEPSDAGKWIARLGLTSGVWPEGQERNEEERFTMGLRRRSRLIDHAAHRLYKHLRGKITRGNYLEDWSDGSPGLAMVESSMERLRDFCAAQGQELVVAMYPDLVSLDENFPYAPVHERVGALCEELGVEYIDLFDALEGQDASLLHAHAHDHHPNRAANAFVAAHLAEVLGERLR